MNTPVPPFSINCTGISWPHTEEEKWCGFGPGDGELLYFEIRTPINRWLCRCTIGHMKQFFETINAYLPTPIEFGELK